MKLDPERASLVVIDVQAAFPKALPTLDHLPRASGVWTAGVEETLTSDKMGKVSDNVPDPQTVIDMISSMSVLRRTPRLADVAETAAFLASDRAAGITGAMTNVTAGLVLR